VNECLEGDEKLSIGVFVCWRTDSCRYKRYPSPRGKLVYPDAGDATRMKVLGLMKEEEAKKGDGAGCKVDECGPMGMDRDLRNGS